MLTLLLGRAGSGKTEACLSEAAAALAGAGPDGDPLVLLAPEQATYQLERVLLDRLPDGAALVRLEVLSFQRLARRVLESAGGLARPRLGEPGRRMILAGLLRELRPELRAFAGSADRPGLAAALARQLSELEAYALTPAELRARAAAAPPGTAERAADLALLWEAERERLRALGLADPGSHLAAAAAALPGTDLARARVWVDGFSGFTAREEGMLAALLRAGADLVVALCLDPRDPLPGGEEDAAHPFAPTRRTLRRLLRLLPGAAVRTLGTGDCPPRFRAGSDLAAVESGLWAGGAGTVPAPEPEAGAGNRPGAGAGTGAGTGAEAGAGNRAGAGAGTGAGTGAEAGAGNRPGAGAGTGAGTGAEDGAGSAPSAASRAAPAAVRFLSAADPRAEAEAAAAEIDRLVRMEGFRYREIAILLRDMETYHDRVDAACAALRIPVFIDRKRPAGRHPAAAALGAALDVAASGWSLAAVRRYLHTDLCGLRRDQADELENLGLAHGIAGAGWYAAEPFALPPAPGSDPPDPESAAAARVRRLARLERLRRRMAAPLRRLEAALRAGPPAAACYGFLEAARAPLAVAEWSAQAQAGGRPEEAEWHRLCWEALMGLLEQMALALGPQPAPAAEVARTLQSGLEDLTVGLVPPRLDQVLCGAVQRSRHPALRAAFVLGLGEGAFPAAQPEEPLLGDADRAALTAAGCELAPTSVERQFAERYLGYIALTRASERLYLSHPAGPGPGELFRRARLAAGHGSPWPDIAEPSARRGAIALAGALALHPEWAEARAWLEAAEPAAADLVLRRDRPAPAIAPELAARLYPGAAAATRLESGAACAYQHFARYGLRLRPRELAEVDPSHVGLLLHAALAAFVRGLLADGRDAALVGAGEAAERRAAALREAEDHVLARLPAGAARGPYLVQAAGRDLKRAAEAVLEHARAGAFRPEAVEEPFERDGVRGRIDRVDAAPGPGGGRHVRVVDYKTGAERFSLAEFVHGLDLAPVLYLAAAAAAAGGGEPAGVFILPVRDPVRSVPGPSAEPAPAPRLLGLAPADPALVALHEAALDGSVTGVRWKRAKSGGPPRMEPYAGAPVTGPGGFPLLFAAARRRVAALRAAALSGEIAPDPYRFGAAAACDRCELLAVCGFDRGAGDRFRFLPAVPDPWSALAREAAEAGA